MCYSGMCKFENYMGDCTCGDTLKFRDKYKFSPCVVGGFATSPEEEEFINNHKQDLDAVYQQYLEDKTKENIKVGELFRR